MKFLRNFFGLNNTPKVSSAVVEEKIDNSRKTFAYVAGLFLIISSLFASQTVNAQLTVPSQKLTAEQVVEPMQAIVNIDFGGFKYSSIYADDNTVVMVLEFTRPEMIIEAQNLPKEDLAMLSDVFTNAIKNDRRLVLEMKNNNINLRVVLRAGNEIIFDQTAYASEL